MTSPCRCNVYDFPHRYSMACYNRERAKRDEETNAMFMDKQTQAQADAEELALFNSAEARAINSRGW